MIPVLSHARDVDVNIWGADNFARWAPKIKGTGRVYSCGPVFRKVFRPQITQPGVQVARRYNAGSQNGISTALWWRTFLFSCRFAPEGNADR